MIICSMCHNPINQQEPYLTITIHNKGGQDRHFPLCSKACAGDHAIQDGWVEYMGAGPTQRFGR